MPIQVRSPVLGKNSWATPQIESLQKKASRFHPLEYRSFKSEEKILNGVDDRDLVILCDERGESFSSREFAKQLEQWTIVSSRQVIFIVGGPFGATAAVKERANKIVTLSPLVFNQELALVVLMEQLFRAQTIINNHPYHND